jgi:hypothetical protein
MQDPLIRDCLSPAGLTAVGRPPVNHQSSLVSATLLVIVIGWPCGPRAVSGNLESYSVSATLPVKVDRLALRPQGRQQAIMNFPPFRQPCWSWLTRSHPRREALCLHAQSSLLSQLRRLGTLIPSQGLLDIYTGTPSLNLSRRAQ